MKPALSPLASACCTILGYLLGEPASSIPSSGSNFLGTFGIGHKPSLFEGVVAILNLYRFLRFPMQDQPMCVAWEGRVTCHQLTVARCNTRSLKHSTAGENCSDLLHLSPFIYSSKVKAKKKRNVSSQ